MSLHRSMNLLIRIRKAEPEHLIAIRLDKEGRTKGPRWNGLNHEEFSVQEQPPAARPNEDRHIAASRAAEAEKARQRAEAEAAISPSQDQESVGAGFKPAASEAAESPAPNDANL